MREILIVGASCFVTAQDSLRNRSCPACLLLYWDARGYSQDNWYMAGIRDYPALLWGREDGSLVDI